LCSSTSTQQLALFDVPAENPDPKKEQITYTRNKPSAREANLDTEQTRLLRQEEALPVLKELKAWLDKEILLVAPAGGIGKAISYALNQWP
jgi:hypothetical protein